MDIVTRLRAAAGDYATDTGICEEAADEIEQLRIEEIKDGRAEIAAVEILAMSMGGIILIRGGGGWRIDRPEFEVPIYGRTAQEAIKNAAIALFGNDLIAAAAQKMSAVPYPRLMAAIEDDIDG